ncbi:thiol peroxidase [Nocardioides sp. InS609-2]|uniref:thiol peroxidase n=1 Tax=Nocardioides sp. InS609-2 TaxID=2760705 RepID=UPI0020BE7ACF|nr:thiol peroxidase [Nocardioides sp. InS609-2]
MATTALKGTPANTVGELPAVGSAAPSWTLVGTDLGEVTSSSTDGKHVVLNIFPSVGTGVCAASVRKFNELAAGLENTTVICVSKDLPFALTAFCGAEGIENVTPLSAFRSTFGEDYGMTLLSGGFEGLLARSVVVLDESGAVTYTQVVPEISTEPDYDAALAALA